MKKIIITSGGTREHIDDVRVLTNISSGKLGAMIAEKFLANELMEEFEVHYVCPNNAKVPFDTLKLSRYNFFYHEVTDVQSVYETLEKLVPEMDVVIHCMAVSDFGFKPCSTKLKSSDPQAFIESLKERIYQTPKILKEIKKWNPDCKLISFKFEVGLEHNDLIDIARKSLIDNNCDLVIANDKTEMVKSKSHIAYAVDRETSTKLNSKDEISNYIFNKI